MIITEDLGKKKNLEFAYSSLGIENLSIKDKWNILFKEEYRENLETNEFFFFLLSRKADILFYDKEKKILKTLFQSVFPDNTIEKIFDIIRKIEEYLFMKNEFSDSSFYLFSNIRQSILNELLPCLFLCPERAHEILEEFGYSEIKTDYSNSCSFKSWKTNIFYYLERQKEGLRESKDLVLLAEQKKSFCKYLFPLLCEIFMFSDFYDENDWQFDFIEKTDIAFFIWDTLFYLKEDFDKECIKEYFRKMKKSLNHSLNYILNEEKKNFLSRFFPEEVSLKTVHNEKDFISLLKQGKIEDYDIDFSDEEKNKKFMKYFADGISKRFRKKGLSVLDEAELSIKFESLVRFFSTAQKKTYEYKDFLFMFEERLAKIIEKRNGR